MAIFALAVVPTVSRLLASQQAIPAWAEICTPQGAKLLASAAVDGESPAPAPAAAMHLDHCPLCGLSASPFAPAPAVTAVVGDAPVRTSPPLFSSAPRPLFAWAAARPRGPPLSA